MRYKIHIIGDKDVIASETERNEVVRQWRIKSGAIMRVGGSDINVNTIRSITEMPEADFRHQEDHRKHIDDVFAQSLINSLRLPPDIRARRELQIRVLPAWRLSGGTREDPQMRLIYDLAIRFFTQYPHYPYIPSRLWWTIVEEQLRAHQYASLFYQYLIRHDEQVERWVKSKGYPKATSVQEEVIS